MYDLGLDQFKPSYWGLPYFNNYNYGIHVGYFENIEPLDDDSDSIFFNNTYDNTVPTLEYDRLRFFGLNFNNPGIVNSSYLKNISRKHKELKPKQGFVVGVVSDYDGPLIGATVKVKGTNIATTTDFDGRYEIVAQKEDVLVVSYVGYESKEIMVGENTVINASLDSSLDEVVVVGYRTTKRSKLTSSVSVVSSDSIEMLPNSEVIQRLQGQVPGLQVQYSSGQPGANPQVLIRGIPSAQSNISPLYIVDGVPVNKEDFKGLNQDDIKPEFPENPPPKLDPKTGKHPEYGKKANRYKKLDPISANSMPPTGDPEIDAVVNKQKTINKIKKMARNK